MFSKIKDESLIYVFILRLSAFLLFEPFECLAGVEVYIFKLTGAVLNH